MTTILQVNLTSAEVSIVRQALRHERDRMVKQGYANLAKLAEDTAKKILVDSNLSVG
jgi:hypothetical protein